MEGMLCHALMLAAVSWYVGHMLDDAQAYSCSMLACKQKTLSS